MLVLVLAGGSTCERGTARETTRPSQDAAKADGAVPRPSEQETPPPVKVSDLVVGVSLGSQHACVWTTDGEAICWGNNRSDEVGLGRRSGWCQPTKVPDLADVRQIVSGPHYSCALHDDGTVTCWGRHPSHEVDRKLDTRRFQLDPPGTTVELVSGGEHLCARAESGAVSCWGVNGYGVLGKPKARSRARPAALPIDDAVELASSSTVVCAARARGRLSCWGDVKHLVADPPRDQYLFGPTDVVGADAQRGLTIGGSTPCVLEPDGAARCWPELYDMTAAGPASVIVGGVDRFFDAGLHGVVCGAAPLARGEDAPGAVGSVRCWQIDRRTITLLGDDDASAALPLGSAVRAFAISPSYYPRDKQHVACAVTGAGRVRCRTKEGNAVTPERLDAIADGHWETDARQACGGFDPDGDGFADDTDACPEEPEVFNGVVDDDGCPDRGASFIEVDEAAGVIRLRRKIEFEIGKATIRRSSFVVLDQLAAVLTAYVRFATVEIQGHSDSQGPDVYGRRPTKDRAEAVRTYLVRHGVDPDRLTTRGYGEDMPIASNRTKAGRAANRRIELVIREYGPDG